MFIEYNVNSKNKAVGDCVIRALTKALSMTWEEVYLALCLQGYKMCDMPSSNAVWGAFLRSKGFKRGIISDSCPDCYTIEDFCKEFPTIKNELFGKPEQFQGYSTEPPQVDNSRQIVEYDGKSDFAQTVNGMSIERVMSVIDEPMTALYIDNRAMYRAVLRQLSE